MTLTSVDGSVAERVRLLASARRAGARIRWPFRLPHAEGTRVAHQIVWSRGVFVGRQAWVNINAPDARLSFGEGTVIGNDLTVTCGGRVTVGAGVLMSARVALLDQLHDFDRWLAPHFGSGLPARFDWSMTDARPVTIGDGTWLGINVVVLPGVTIGTGCVVGANSVVTGDLPDYSIAAGAPARVLRRVAGAPAA